MVFSRMERWLGAVDEKDMLKCCFMAFMLTWECPHLSIISCEVQREDHQRECERLSGKLSVQLLGKPFNFALKRAERTNTVDNLVNFSGSRFMCFPLISCCFANV